MIIYNFVGVDIAKDSFVVAKHGDKKNHYQTFDNQPAGFKKFLAWLEKHAQMPWVCLEATGHYSERLAIFLHQHQVQVSIVNPLQIKHYAIAILARNKNDIIDARIIAEYAKCKQPRLFKPRSLHQKQVRELMQLMDTLKQQKTQLLNQQVSIECALTKKSFSKIISKLELQIEKIEQDIDEVVKSDPEFVKKVSWLSEIKGIGKTSAYAILAYLPDIQLFKTAKQLAAFIGLTPRQRQSGKFLGKTCLSKFGDARLRKAFYMPALSAKKHNIYLQPFVGRLKANGLAEKSIVGAVMRKLVHIIFGMLKHNQPFNPAFI